MAERTLSTPSETIAASPWMLLEGASLGALLSLGLSLRNLFDIALDDRIGGISVPTIHRFLATDYRFEVLRAVLELLALSVVVGTLSGAAVGLLEWLRARWLRLEGLPLLARLAKLACLIGALWSWVFLLDVAARPALHQAHLFQQGGARAWLQIVVADLLGSSGVMLLGSIAVLFYWFWPARARLGELRVKPRTLCIALGVMTVGWGATALSRSLSGRVAQSAVDQRPNVLILAADSLRPDRLDARRAPHLAELRGRATSFERAYTPLARTFPAWVSMSTGQYPHHHGIRHMFPRWSTREREFDTLARHFGAAGYRTAVVGDFAADIFRRIDLGYQSVRTPTFTLRELLREQLLRNEPWLIAFIRGKFMRWLVPVVSEISDATDPNAVSEVAIEEIDRAEGKPFFLTVFYSTTHFPYAAPGPYHRQFRAPGYDGPFRYAKADTLTRDERLSPADIEQVRALYDGAVAATDAAVAEILEALRRRALDRRTLVIVTADHGEELYEYGRTQGHGDHLRAESALRVPLLIVDPRQPTPRRTTSPVSLVDLAPTLLELAQLPPLPQADGRSLAAALRGEPLPSRPVYSETGLWFTEVIAEVPLSSRIPYPDLTQLTEVDRSHGDQVVIRAHYEPIAIAAKHRMLQQGDLRLLYLPARDGVRFELCDIEQDPACVVDRSREQAEPLERLKAEFWRFAAEDPAVIRQGDRLMPRSSEQEP